MKSSADTSSTREKLFGFSLASVLSRSKTEPVPALERMRLAASRLQNRMLFTLMSSAVAKRRGRDSVKPRRSTVFWASSNILTVKIGLGRL